MQKIRNYLLNTLALTPVIVTFIQMIVFFGSGFSLAEIDNSDLPYWEAYIIVNLLPLIFYTQRSSFLYWLIWFCLMLTDLYFIAVTLFAIGLFEALIKLLSRH